jgi:glycosyltransferase involved in cell wall biosynthesis
MTEQPDPTVAIVHDYLTQRGGAERVVLAMARAFPDAPIYTAVYDPDATFPEFGKLDVRPLWTNRIGVLRREHRRGLLLYPLAFGSVRVAADVAVCSSSGFAHGIRVQGRKIVYCHTPARWLYDEAAPYLANQAAAVRLALRLCRAPLRAWDRKAAGSADVVLANSTAVRTRIHDVYGIDAEVVPPPVERPAPVGSSPLSEVDPGYLLCVSRLLAYKNVDVVLRAASRLPGVQFVVVGTGPEVERLSALAPPNAKLVGEVSDTTLSWLYANSAGLVSASFEDFGLVPVEAAAYGKPSAVLRAGGFLDTVVDRVTGVFFDSLDEKAVAEAMQELLARRWEPERLKMHAESFGHEQFARALRGWVCRPN